MTTSKLARRHKVGQVFTPATPINEKALFAGRIAQINTVVDTICQRGKHAIIYGERGVGKTSLSNVLSEILREGGQTVVSPRVVCNSGDTFDAVWRRAFEQINLHRQTEGFGFSTERKTEQFDLASQLPDQITPEVVRRALAGIGASCVLILIMDEFDRFPDAPSTRLFADTIKLLSDYAIPVTLVIVGVADGVDSLIQGHESILRNLVQIPMPRMSHQELSELVVERLPSIGMTILPESLDKICVLSRGLPHYTHLIAQHAAWNAIEREETEINNAHVRIALGSAIAECQQTIRNAYHKATSSPQKDHLFKEVLLACALARVDELGYFAPADVRTPMSRIMRRSYEIPAFIRHLKQFGEEQKGNVLEEIGEKYQRRFRFRNPLMQPYVVMRGIADRLIELDDIPSDASTGVPPINGQESPSPGVDQK